MEKKMRMNSFEGKRILSLIRDGDYAHAGEEEAIELAMRSIPKQADRLVLDAGCGRGGTAKYVQDHGWGSMVGIDREADSIALARQTCPDVRFVACDVVDVAKALDRRFDLIYLFNSFYAFSDQAGALAALGGVAGASGRLMIFDYVDLGNYHTMPIMNGDEPFLPHPLRLSTFGDMLQATGWLLLEIEEINEAYERWYDALVERIERKRAQIIELVGLEAFTSVRSLYAQMLASIRRGSLGGAIVHAVRVD